jgi:hypothetical protein
MTYHYWYSEEQEIRTYMNFAMALEIGHVSTFDIPHKNTCRLQIGEETVDVVYNYCAQEQNAYDSWDIQDLNYLGSNDGSRIHIHQMKVPEIVERMKELQIPVPSILLHKSV